VPAIFVREDAGTALSHVGGMGGRSAVGVVVMVWAGMLACAHSDTGLASHAILMAAGVAMLLAACLALTTPLAAPDPSRPTATRVLDHTARRWGVNAGRIRRLRTQVVRLHSPLADLAVVVALVLAGWARAAGHRDVLAHQRQLLDSGLRRIEARVIEPPLRESGMPSATVRVTASAPPLIRGSRLRLWLPPGSTAECGDRIAAMVLVDPPGPPRNPGGPDARASADAAAIIGWGRALTATVLDSTSVWSWPRATSARWRRAIEAVFARRLTPAAREIVTPLVVGDRTALSSELDAAFRAAGVVHLLALSGLHVTWMAGVGRALVAMFGGGVRMRAVAGAMCALLYAMLAGPLPSLARAVATEGFVAGAVLARRALDPVQALALSALAGLAVAPGWADDLGFQLSCVATLGLLTIGAGLSHGVSRAGRARHILDLALPTASAQLTALPLLLARLHTVSWVAPFTNLAAVPIAGLLLAAAWLAAVWEMVLPGTARAAFAACEALVAGLRWVTELGAALPHAALSTGEGAGSAWAAAVGAALLVHALVPRRTLADRARRADAHRIGCGIAGAACITAALAVACGSHPLAPRAGAAWLVVLDVGQGDATALATPQGWWLVDAGPKSPRGDAGERFVVPFLRWAGVRVLDGLVLTHDDLDHTGGAPAVLRAIGARRRFAPPARPDAPGPGPRFHATAVARGDTLTRNPLMRVLWPPRAMPPGWSDNHAGIAIELACDTTRVLLTADLDTLAECALEMRPLAVLRVAHHGSRTSTAIELLQRTHPRLAVISCGRRNHYGHPHPSVLARLAAAGVPVRRTDESGAIWFELTPAGAREIDWRRGRKALRATPDEALPRAVAPRP